MITERERTKKKKNDVLRDRQSTWNKMRARMNETQRERERGGERSSSRKETNKEKKHSNEGRIFFQ